MPEDKGKSSRPSGEFMIQDRDHLGDLGQMGGESRGVVARQSQQSHSDNRQHGQQGGERSRKRRTKFL
jgi:hypothetical protein